MRMRATFGSAAPSLFPILTSSFPIPLPPLTIYLDQAYLRHHLGAFSRPAVNFQGAAQQCHPLTHAGETQTLARSTPVGDPLRVEARPPIPHLQTNRVVQAPECDPYTGGGSMLVDIGESFLVVDLGAFATDLLDLQADGGAKPEIVERGGPQICYDVPGLTDRLLH